MLSFIFRFIVANLVWRMCTRIIFPTLMVLFMLFWTQLSHAQPSRCSHFYPGQVAPDYINQKLSISVRELCNEAFGVFHSGISKTPLWVAERLSRSSLAEAKGLKRANNFHPDDRLHPSERAELTDYKGSGLDRGHLAPSANMPSVSAQYESFSLANMMPQAPELNRGDWEGVESTLRQYAKQNGELFVLTGPAFIGNRVSKVGRVFVPSHVWKAVYDPKAKSAGAYWFANVNDAKAEYLSIDELASRIGIQPFPSLPAAVRHERMDLPEPKRYRSARSNNYNGGSVEQQVWSSINRILR